MVDPGSRRAQGGMNVDGMQWKIWLREHSREVLETIGLSREDRILDFGCGMGHYTFPAARLGGCVF